MVFSGVRRDACTKRLVLTEIALVRRNLAFALRRRLRFPLAMASKEARFPKRKRGHARTNARRLRHLARQALRGVGPRPRALCEERFFPCRKRISQYCRGYQEQPAGWRRSSILRG